VLVSFLLGPRTAVGLSRSLTSYSGVIFGAACAEESVMAAMSDRRRGEGYVVTGR
jgi:hypothetical protein